MKATVIYTNFDTDSRVVTYHAVVNHEDGSTDVHHFNFSYPWDKDLNEDKDHKHIIDTLKRIYGPRIEIEFIRPLKMAYRYFSYR